MLVAALWQAASGLVSVGRRLRWGRRCCCCWGWLLVIGWAMGMVLCPSVVVVAAGARLSLMGLVLGAVVVACHPRT